MTVLTDGLAPPTSRKAPNRPPAASRVTRSLASATGGNRPKSAESLGHISIALRMARACDALDDVRRHADAFDAEITHLIALFGGEILRHARYGYEEATLDDLAAKVAASWSAPRRTEASA